MGELPTFKELDRFDRPAPKWLTSNFDVRFRHLSANSRIGGLAMELLDDYRDASDLQNTEPVESFSSEETIPLMLGLERFKTFCRLYEAIIDGMEQLSKSTESKPVTEMILAPAGVIDEVCDDMVNHVDRRWENCREVGDNLQELTIQVKTLLNTEIDMHFRGQQAFILPEYIPSQKPAGDDPHFYYEV